MSWGSSPIEEMAKAAMLASLIYCDEFTYSAKWVVGTATALGANAEVEVQIQINSDSDFVIQSREMVAFIDGPTIIPDPDYLVNMVTAGSGRQLVNQRQHVLTYLGGFQLGRSRCRLTSPKLIQANSTLSIILQNRTAVAANYVEVALHGFKVFYQQGGSRSQIFHAL